MDFDIIVVRISGSSDLTYWTDKSGFVRKGPSVFAILCLEEPRFLDSELSLSAFSGSSDLTHWTDKSVFVRKDPYLAILCFFEEPLNLLCYRLSSIRLRLRWAPLALIPDLTIRFIRDLPSIGAIRSPNIHSLNSNYLETASK